MSVWIAPVFLPHAGCPHRCVFCDQGRVAGASAVPSVREVRDRLARMFQTSKRNRRAGTRQIAFYGGSFTMLPASVQESYLAAARPFVREGWVDSIRISTRPDALGWAEISLLRKWDVATVEVGIQSLSDRVLEESGRGHSSRAGMEAITRAKDAGFEIGAQIMLGLPGDRGLESILTAEMLCSLRPDFVRIYPVVVFEGTELAVRMRKGRYSPLRLEDAVALAARVLEVFDLFGIPVIRIGLLHGGGLGSGVGHVLAGPVHPAFGHLVRCRLFGERAARVLASSKDSGGNVLRLRIHPRDRSQLHGHKGETLALLKEATGARRIEIVEDETVRRGSVLQERIDARRRDGGPYPCGSEASLEGILEAGPP